MTRLLEGEPGNDELADAIGRVMRELREEDDEDEGKTFRAVVRQELQHMGQTLKDHRDEVHERVSKVEARQDAMLLLIAGAVVAQLVVPLL